MIFLKKVKEIKKKKKVKGKEKNILLLQ